MARAVGDAVGARGSLIGVEEGGAGADSVGMARAVGDAVGPRGSLIGVEEGGEGAADRVG